MRKPSPMGFRGYSLSLQLLVCLIGSLLLIFSLLGFHNVDLHRRHLEEMTHASADALSDIIKASTRQSMLENHREDLYQILKTIGKNPNIYRIRLFDKEGHISYSSDESEINTVVDTNAEACYKCHAQEQPLSKLNRPERVRTYVLDTGERVLGVINPVQNEPSCSNASCHAHRPEQQVLGVLDVTMSLASVDRTIRQGQKALVLNLFAAVAIISSIVGGLVWAMVHKRVHRLFVGTKHVAAGDLEHRIPESGRDELGELARSFNRMTAQLKKANDQLKDWARTLESRVEAKTRELKEAHEQMITVERMASMGKLAAMVAHEINNPLTGILSSARLLLRRLERKTLLENGDQGCREHLEMIAAESARCGEIVKNLLQFARQGKGDYEPTDPGALLRESLRLVQHKIELMNLEVRAQIAEEIAAILCDPSEVKQALVAVLINACEAMEPGNGTLEVGARHLPADGAVEIWVKDSGRGMPEETKRHMFEPFFTTKEGGSVRLGLAVVRGIINRHSGRIEVESELGRGTTVSIRLPVCSEDGSETRTREDPGCDG